MTPRFLPALLATALLFSSGLAKADDPAPPPEAAPSEQTDNTQDKCLKVAVNPVTGHAVCLEPRGAPVDPPSRESLNRPCPPREHDDDPWTVYEHWSGC